MTAPMLDFDCSILFLKSRACYSAFASLLAMLNLPNRLFQSVLTKLSILLFEFIDDLLVKPSLPIRMILLLFCWRLSFIGLIRAHSQSSRHLSFRWFFFFVREAQYSIFGSLNDIICSSTALSMLGLIPEETNGSSF